MTCASLSLAVASLLFPRVWLKFVLAFWLVCLVELLLWSASIVVPNRPARCFILFRLFLPAFPFRCALLAQRLRSVRLVFSCVAQFAFPTRSLRRPVHVHLFASSIPFLVSSCAVRPSPPPVRFVFSFVVLRTPGLPLPVACLSV